MMRPRQPGQAGKPGRSAQPPSTPQEQLTSLLAKACHEKESEDVRVSALRSLYALLKTPEGGSAGAAAAAAAWPRLLELLAVPQAAVRQSAAPVLGLLGALATRPESKSPSLLFDWALPLLATSANGVGAQFWVLISLRECLAAIDLGALKRWANAVLAACERLLEAEDTSMHLLPPLLGVVIQAVRHTPSLKARVRNLTDILLGWALDPSLPDSARPHIANTLISFQTGWPHEAAFTLDWLNNLTNDLEQAGKPDAPTTVAQLRRLLALSTCLAAISRACASGLQGIFAGFHGLLPRITAALTTAHAKFKGLLAAPNSIYTFLEELCLQVDTLMTVAAGAATIPGNPPADALKGAGPPMQMAEFYPIAIDFILELLSSPAARASGLVAPIRLHARLLQLLARQETPPTLRSVQHLLRPGSSFAQLRLHADPSLVALVGQAYISLLQHPDADISGASLAALLTEAQSLPTAQTPASDTQQPWPKNQGHNSKDQLQASCEMSNAHSVAASSPPQALPQREEKVPMAELKQRQLLARWGLEVLQGALREQGGGLGGMVWLALWPLVLPDGSLAGQSALWLLAFSILQDLACQSNAAFGEHDSLTAHLVQLVTASPLPQAQVAALQWLMALQMEQIRTISTAEAPTAAGLQNPVSLDVDAAQGGPGAVIQPEMPKPSPRDSSDDIADVAAALEVPASREDSLPIQVGTGESAPASPSPRRRAEITHTAGSPPALPGIGSASGEYAEERRTNAGLTDVPGSVAVSVEGAATAALTDVLSSEAAVAEIPGPVWDAVFGAATGARDSSLRLVATRALLQFLQPPRRVGDRQLAALLSAAAERLGDVARDVRSAWRDMLNGIAAIQDDGIFSVASSTQGLYAAGKEGGQPWWQHSLAIRPQARVFKPARLAELISFLARAKPLASWDPGGDTAEWLLRIFSSSPVLPGVADNLDIRDFTSLPMLAWWAVQESAKQCIAARMRTHFGGPAQSFTALEKALQHAISSPKAAASPPAAAVLNVSASPTKPTERASKDYRAGAGDTRGRSTARDRGSRADRGALKASDMGANAGDDQEGEQQKTGQSQVNIRDYRPVWLLLEFMGALERNVHHAAEGSEAREELSPPVLAFFVANKKVCEDWFARMRGLMLRASVQADHHHAVIYHAHARISELKGQLRALVTLEAKPSDVPASEALQVLPTEPVADSTDEPAQPKILTRRTSVQAPTSIQSRSASPLKSDPGAERVPLKPPERLMLELNSTLRCAATSLDKSGEADAIRGLHAYCLRSFSPLAGLLEKVGAKGSLELSLAWMPSMALHAAGSCEAAAAGYTTVIEQAVRGIGDGDNDSSARFMDGESLAFTVAQAAEAYAAVADWDGLEAFLARLEESRSNTRQYLKALQLAPAETNRHLALVSLERKDYTTAQGLMDLSTWGPNHSHSGHQEPPFQPGKPLAAAEGALHRALLTIETRGVNRGRWRDDVAAAVQEGRSAATLPLELDGHVGGSAMAPMLELLRCLDAARARSERGRGSVRGSSPSGSSPRGASLEPRDSAMDDMSVQAGLGIGKASIYEELAALGFPPADRSFPSGQLSATRVAGMTRELRVAGTVDPMAMQTSFVAVLGRISREAAAAGNWKMAWSALARAELSPLLDSRPALAQALRLQRLRLRFHSGHQKEAFQQLWQETVPALSVQSPNKAGEADVAAEACRVLSSWMALAGAHGGIDAPQAAQIHQLTTHNGLADAALASANAASIADKIVGMQHAQLALLAAGARLAPHSAAAWGAYANFLHSCLLQEVRGTLVLSRLAIEASCQRLAAVQPSRPELAMPELLRLLSLLQNSSSKEVGALAEQLYRVPPALWEAVVPQLFSALARPSPELHRVAGGLLQRLEEAVPAAVLYPALVEQQQTDSGVSEELRELVQQCRQREPQVVAQLELMMEEMARITVLPTELWHTTLTEVQADVARRLVTLQSEAERLAEQSGLQDEDRQRILNERFMAVMAPAVLVLQRRLRTSGVQDPQTPQEAWFKRHFLHRLQHIIASLQQPVALDLSQPKSVLEPMKALTKAIAGYLNEASIRLSSISPSLAALSGTSIPMPGLQGKSKQTGAERLTVASLGPEVEMLHTKTRPKKLVLFASDGQRLTFLLKGREDLRTDERLLQFLRLSSALLQEDPGAAGRRLRARSFAVTPLGPRVGLIQWVEDTKPLYAMYINWQRRTAARSAAVKAEQEDKGPAEKRTKEPPRAMDMFYARLLPALEAAGVGKLASRKEWPLEVLRKVLAGLMRDTPRNLLERQIWSGSTSSADWWRRQQNYSRSTAVMSMVGYLLGLGDRHLDNILLDQRSTEMVHIDYNIVFDRGRKLPVPEVVPFRLTHTLQAALGVAGVEGVFRSSCEAVLATMRRNDHAVKLLIEFVLNDPLVDWVPDREDAAARKGMEVAVLLNLFRSRMDEMRPALTAALHRLKEVLHESGMAMTAFSAAFEPAVATAKIAHDARLCAEEQRGIFEGARQGLRQQWEHAHRAAEERQQWGSQLQSLREAARLVIQECQASGEPHAQMVAKLRQKAVEELELPGKYYLAAQCQAPLGLVTEIESTTGAHSILSVLKQGYSAPLSVPAELLGLCTAVDERSAELLKARDTALGTCVTALKEYAAAIKLLLPESYWRTSHQQQWAVAFTAAVEGQSAQAVEDAVQLVPKDKGDVVLMSIWRALQRAGELQQPNPGAGEEVATRQQELLKVAADIAPASRAGALASAQATVVANVRAKLLASLDVKQASFEDVHEALLEAAVPLVALERIVAKSLPPDAPRDYPWGAGPVAALQRSVAVLQAVRAVVDKSVQCMLPVLAGFAADWAPQWYQELAAFWGALSSWKSLQEAAELHQWQQQHGMDIHEAERDVLYRSMQEWMESMSALLDPTSATSAVGADASIPIKPLWEVLRAIYSLLQRLRAPLEDLARASRVSLEFPGVPSQLQQCGFYAFCATLLDSLAPRELSNGSAAADLGGRMQAGLCDLLRAVLAPMVLHALEVWGLSDELAQTDALQQEESTAEQKCSPEHLASKGEIDNNSNPSTGLQSPALLEVMTRYTTALAAAAKARSRKAITEVAPGHEEWREWVARHQAACEWLSPTVHEAALASGQSRLESIAPGHPKLRSRAEVLLAVRTAHAELQPLQAALAAWMPHSSTAEGRLEAVIKSKDTDLLATVKHYLALRNQWLILSQEQTDKFSSLAEAVLAFEASRDGRVWGAAALHEAAFAANISLMDQLQTCAKALYAADSQVGDARQKSVDLQSAAAAAAHTVQECSAAARKAGARFLSLAGALVQTGEALGFPVHSLLEAAPDIKKPLAEAAGVLIELSRATQGMETVQIIHQAATRAHNSASAILAELSGLPLPLCGLTDALMSVGLPSATTLQDMMQKGGTQELAAGAAAIIDVVLPLWEGNGNKLPDLLALEKSAGMLYIQLDQLTASASTVAAAIQQEHALPADHPNQLRSTSHRIANGSEPSAAVLVPDGAAHSVPLRTQEAHWEALEGLSRTQELTSYAAPPSATILAEGASPSSSESARHIPPAWPQLPAQAHERKALSIEAGKRVAAREAFSVSALRRFNAKLGGIDGGGQKMSVAEQVDILLRQATNLDSLAQMFEGWMPWM